MTDWERSSLPAGYHLRTGSSLDRSRLIKFMQQTYQELYPDCCISHLAETVEQYLSQETPLWWVELVAEKGSEPLPGLAPFPKISTPIACLWLGNAIDQTTGDRHAHIFLLYVIPIHRRKGIGSALMYHAETWARQRGDRQIGLQVFQSNQPALSLYNRLGYRTQFLWMVKPLSGGSEG